MKVWEWFREKVAVRRSSEQFEGRLARQYAEQNLAVAEREVKTPLVQMHHENHIQPKINALIRRSAERRT